MNAHVRYTRYVNARLIKERAQAVGVTIVGVGMIVLGIIALGDDDVTCGGQTMEQGEVCESTRNGETTAERDYEAQSDENTLTGWLLAGGGAAMVVGGGFWTAAAFTRKKRITADEAAAGLTPATVVAARRSGGRQQALPQRPGPPQSPQGFAGPHPPDGRATNGTRQPGGPQHPFH